MNDVADILVVGAGPVGLTLALQAHALGADVRVVERRPRLLRPSRAMIVHPRTLEMLRPLNVVDALLSRAVPVPQARLHVGGQVISASLDDLELPDTAYPHLTLVRQADVESVLAAALTARGVPVERGTELAGCVTGGGRPWAEAALRTPGGDLRARCRWVAGCDGTDSTVRRLAGLLRPETGYRQEVLLADVDVTGLPPGETMHVHAGRHGLCFLFPYGERATWRLLITRPATGPVTGSARPGPPPDRAELQMLLDRSRVAVRIASVAWSTRLRLRHGVARAYRRGPLFLAGDAAHVHSPAGGLGMNIGIQDAINLGWKLALAPHSTHPDRLLDSYPEERRRAALLTRRLTNLIFYAESGPDPLAVSVRSVLLPLAAPLLPVLMRRRRLVAGVVRLLGQFDLSYRNAPLSRAAPRRDSPLRPGDRLPDRPATEGVRLPELTARPGVHALLDRDAPTITTGDTVVHVHRLTGVPGEGVLVVRPDGHVGACADRADDPAVTAWLATIGARVAVAPPGR
jgi:2-polyprenyl-6-methoxyphenol hydroxylase-like FAD-dependent oxidoreductase